MIAIDQGGGKWQGAVTDCLSRPILPLFPTCFPYRIFGKQRPSENARSALFYWQNRQCLSSQPSAAARGARN
jgi:hypothetical protein